MIAWKFSHTLYREQNGSHEYIVPLSKVAQDWLGKDTWHEMIFVSMPLVYWPAQGSICHFKEYKRPLSADIKDCCTLVR